MIPLIAPAPTLRELNDRSRSFLHALRDDRYSETYDKLITRDSIWLQSATLWPLMVMREKGVDALLQWELGTTDLSPSQVFALMFQMDAGQNRTQFFQGMAASMPKSGWYEFSDSDAMAFLDGPNAVLIAGTPKIPLIMLFGEEGRDGYKIDLGSLALFSMTITASDMYRIGKRALELGKHNYATSYLEIASGLQPFYLRIQRLIIHHFAVGKFATDERKAQLQAEYATVLQAQTDLSSLSTDRGDTKTRLYDCLRSDRFNLDDLEDLCFRMRVAWDDMAGDTISKKARSIVDHFSRLGKLDELRLMIVTRRPDLADTVNSSPATGC